MDFEEFFTNISSIESFKFVPLNQPLLIHGDGDLKVPYAAFALAWTPYEDGILNAIFTHALVVRRVMPKGHELHVVRQFVGEPTNDGQWQYSPYGIHKTWIKKWIAENPNDILRGGIAVAKANIRWT